jgi:hypothetical protein
MIEIVPARPFHVGTIARRMRAIDKLESLTSGHTPKQALRLGLRASSIVLTALVDGRPEAMFGACPISAVEGRARVWMLMTDEAERQHRALLRLGWRYTQALHEHYAILENYVHADNARSIRWLLRLGYAVGSVDVIGGQPMRPFVRCLLS